MSGLLTVPNITLGSNGKINSYDDYHYIQISQPTDTLTIQEFGKIIFSIGQTKTEIGRINSSGMTITGAISATSLSGSGSELTNLNYNNISTNKPDLTLYAVKSNVDSSLNSLNTNKQNNLTFSSPLVNTTNTISFNESAITTLTNFYNQTQSDGRYLRLTGGTISGTLIINTELQVTTTTNYNQIKLKNNNKWNICINVI